MKKILENVNIVLTRTKNQSVETIAQLEKLGANVLSFPTIKITSIEDNDDLNYTIKRINEFNTIIFTSENAVRHLINKISKLEVSFDPQAYFIISIGDKTTQVCKEFGFRVDFQSQLASSEDLVKELGYIDLVGRKIIIPCSSLSKSSQFEALEDQGATVTALPVYTNTINDKENLTTELEQLNSNRFNLFVFTSPSTYKGYIQIMDITNPQQYFENKNIAVIGPITRSALQEHGLEPNIFPSNFTMNYLIEEIKKFYTVNNVARQNVSSPG